VDPSTGRVYFKRGFDPVTGTYRGATSSTESEASMVDKLVKENGWSREDAIDFIIGRRRKKSNDDTKQMGGMLYNPMDVIWNY
jgi:hypothetical protein